MSPNQGLALLIDDALLVDGEIQIKKRRHPSGGGTVVNLTVWEPTEGDFPRAAIRLQGSTTMDALDQLEKRLEKQAAPA